MVSYGQAVPGLAASFVDHADDLDMSYMIRRLLSLIDQEYGPAVWDAVPMSVLQGWHPYRAGSCSPLFPWDCGRVRQEFSMSPLQVSSVACCWAESQGIGHIDRPRDMETCWMSAKASGILSTARELQRYEKAQSQDDMTAWLPCWPSTIELTRALERGIGANVITE